MIRPVVTGLSSAPSSKNMQYDLSERNVKKLPDKYEGKDPQIVEAAQGMESLFLEYMMKVMRQTVPKNEMDLESPATEIYRSMLDSEVADKSAHSQGIGLADQIIDYLDPSRYTQIRNRAPGTGGTHEGK